MSKEIIEALAHLVALLVAERHQPPEEGGWIRTRNTAYRPKNPPAPPREPESDKHAQIEVKRVRNPNDSRGNLERRRKISEACTGVQKTCSRCGASGVNLRTCISRGGPGDLLYQQHREPITHNPHYPRWGDMAKQESF